MNEPQRAYANVKSSPETQLGIVKNDFILTNKDSQLSASTSKAGNLVIGGRMKEQEKRKSYMKTVTFVLTLAALVGVTFSSTVEASPEPVAAIAKTKDAGLIIDKKALAEVNAWFGEWISLLVQSDPNKASTLFISKGRMRAKAKTIAGSEKLCLTLSSYFGANTVQHAELVAHFRMSSRSIVLYYMIHTENKSVLMTMPLVKNGIKWRHLGVNTTDTWTEHIDRLSKADRLATPTTVYMPRNK